MKHRLVVAAAVATAGVSAPAYAQDALGFRIEGRLALEQDKLEASLPNPEDDDDEDGDEFLTSTESHSGIAFGAELGYDAVIGSGFVLGAYAGAEFGGSESCVEIIDDDLACASVGRTFTLGGRAGMLISDAILLYAKGGYSNGKLEASYDDDVTDNDDDDPGDIAEFSGAKGGYHIGGGVEWGLARGIHAKAEYVYTKYGTQSYLLGDDDDDPALDVSSNRHQFFVGIGLRF